MKKKIILLFSTVSHIAIFAATDVHKEECVHLDITSRPASEDVDTFIGISKKIYISTAYTRNPILSEDGEYILKNLSVQKEDTVFNYPCRFSKNENIGFIYEMIEGTNVPLQLDFNEGQIVAVKNLLTNESIDSKLTASDDGYPHAITLYDLSVVGAIGTPNAHFTIDEQGHATVHVDTLYKNVKTLLKEQSTLSGEFGSRFSTVETRLQSLPSDIATEVNQQISETLSDFKETLSDFKKESLTTTESVTENMANKLAATTVCQAQKIIESITGTRESIMERNADLIKCVNLIIQKQSEERIIEEDIRNTLLKNIHSTFDKTNTAFDSQTAKLISTTQHIVKQSTEKVCLSVEHTEEVIVGILEKLLGITLNRGDVDDANLLQQLTMLIESMFERSAQSEDVRMAINTMTQVYNTHGQLPLLYLGSMESMLYGHTNMSKKVIVSPINTYISKFKSLTKHEFVNDLRVPLSDIIEKMTIISNFFRSTDTITLSRTLPMFIKVFGTKFPIYDESAVNITKYCHNAHFSAEDFGLYGWVKDIYYTLNDFCKAVEQKDANIVGKGRITRGKIQSLLKGMLDDENYAIPVTHFNGLQDFPKILQHCVDTIITIQENSTVVRIEKKIDELISAITEEQQSFVDKSHELIRAITSATSLLYGITLPGHNPHKHKKGILSDAVKAPLFADSFV